MSEDLRLSPQAEGTYTWHLPLSDVRKPWITAKATSATFAVGGASWQILAFPAGNVQDARKVVSLYLKCLKTDSTVRAIFTIAMVNADPPKTLSKEAAYEFSDSPSDDWGFIAYALRSTVFARTGGYVDVSSNSLIIQVSVRVEPEAPSVASALAESFYANSAVLPAFLPPNQHDVDAPRQYICCISQALMQDPVTAADGHTYERREIEAWLAKCDSQGHARTSPVTREVFLHITLNPNRALRSLINEWQQQQCQT